MVVLIGGEKGGTGKTTLATSLAAARAAAVPDGRGVLLVDTDKQGSASFWATMREETAGTRLAGEGGGALPAVSCVQVFGKAVSRQVADLAERYADVVVDAGGRDSVELRAAMVVADRLFVPLQASQFDVWTLERMDDLVGQAQAINPRLQAAVVINRASSHPRAREAEEVRQLLADFEHLTFSGVVFHDRVAFRRAAGEGLSALEASDPDPRAVSELGAWYQAVYGTPLPDEVTHHARTTT